MKEFEGRPAWIALIAAAQVVERSLKFEGTMRSLDIEVGDALILSEQTGV